MTIFVDADACPVTRIVERAARRNKVPVTLLCDTNHILSSDYSTVRTVSAGPDAVDLVLVNSLHPGDLVVTQDYGVAALALGRRAYAIHQSGMWYTDDNIDGLLNERAMAKKARMSHKKNHVRGPKKRTAQDDVCFEASFQKLLLEALKAEQE